VLWTRGVAGRPLTESVRPDRLPDATAPLGPLLATLHASSVATTSSIGVDDLLVEARKKTDKLARAHPPIGPAGDRPGGRRDQAPPRGRPRAWVHPARRLPLDQLVSSTAGPVLVDLDSLLVGPPEVDLAEFLVDLALRDFPTPSRTRSPARCCRRTPQPPGPTSTPPSCPSAPMPSS
jgi:hypothetical protein